MRTRSGIRTILILTVVGCVVSAQQARPESVFQAARARSFTNLAIGALALSPGFPEAVSHLPYVSLVADTVETVEIEVEEEKEGRSYKDLAAFAIVTVIVGYAVIELMRPDDEESKSGNNGKPIPTLTSSFGVSMPFTR